MTQSTDNVSENKCLIHQCFSVIAEAPDCDYIKTTTLSDRQKVVMAALRQHKIPIVILPMTEKDANIFTEKKVMLSTDMTLEQSLTGFKRKFLRLESDIKGCRLGSKDNVDVFTHKDISGVDVRKICMQEIYTKCKCITDGMLYIYLSVSDNSSEINASSDNSYSKLPPTRGYYNVNYLMRHLDFECGIKLERSHLINFLAQHGYSPKSEFDTVKY